MKKILTLVCAIMPMLLNAELKVLAFAGSTRADSFNKKLVLEAAEQARQMGAKVTIVDLKDFPMPLYDADHEKQSGMPENAKKLRKMMIEHDAMIICTPEYNASVSAVLKNAIDWTSRSESGGSSRDAYKGKKVVIMSAAAGRGGGARALVHLRAILEDVGATVVPSQVGVARAYESTPESESKKIASLKQGLQELLAPSEKLALTSSQ